MVSLTDWCIRQANHADVRNVTRFLDEAHWIHQHLDWLNPESFIDKNPFLLMHNEDELIGCIACPLSLHHVSWIRIFGVDLHYDLQEIWRILWLNARKELETLGCQISAALVMSSWMEPLLLKSGFDESNAVIFLEWIANSEPKIHPVPGNLRNVRHEDMEPLIELDQIAFKGIWCNPRDELLEAFKSASISTVFEHEGQLIGYQISTTSVWGAHLARLAVHPNWQGKGIGHFLVSELMHQVRRRGHQRLTVNTQEDNLQSLSLYRRLGFMETGDRYPVLELNI
jgi:ribosomal protein S18 acetylase RimI-like enzyme